jgi:hypothetical protein
MRPIDAPVPDGRTQRRSRGVSLTVLLGAFALAISATSARPQGAAKPRPVAIFIKGFDAASLIENTDFKRAITAAFTHHEVRFFGFGHDRERLMAAIPTADVLYFSGHSPPPVNGMQTLLVRPSASNPNPLTPKKNSVLTSADVATALQGKTGPRLVIINGCETTKITDGVPADKRLNAGFGITDATRGRAFIGWDYPVVGNKKDATFRDMLAAWTKFDGRNYRELGTVLNETDWTPTKPPVLIGDRKLWYRTAFAPAG